MAVMVNKFATDVTLSKEAEEEMRKLFMFGDIDNDGFITEVEFRYVMTRDGSKVTDDEVKSAIQGGDVDGDGRLNYDEFVKVMIKMSDDERARAKKFATDVTLSKEAEEEMRKLFMFGDIDNDGFITEAEFRYVMTRDGSKVTDDEVKIFIQGFDVDGDGRLNYDEFVKVMMKLAAMVKNFTTDVPLSKEEEIEMKGLFMGSDIDSDGYITAAEFLYAVTTNGGKVTEDDIKNAIRVADLDGDGRLSYDEFVKYKMAMKMIDKAAMRKKYDVDGDGRLNYDEFVKVLLAMRGILNPSYLEG